MNQEHDDAIEALLRRQFDGPVPDEGFSYRVMQRLPIRRRRIAWPLWGGVLAGAGACWWSLLFSPLLRVGWRDILGGNLSATAITLLLVMTSVCLLASWWAIAEVEDR
jgi:hypothetical protein